MGKVNVVLCDVKPCSLPAEREFEVNGEKVYVCGEKCFATFWSREYHNWRKSSFRYRMQVFPEMKPAGLNVHKNSADKLPEVDIFGSDLHLQKPV